MTPFANGDNFCNMLIITGNQANMLVIFNQDRLLSLGVYGVPSRKHREGEGEKRNGSECQTSYQELKRRFEGAGFFLHYK